MVVLFLDIDRKTNQEMGLNIGKSLKVEKLILVIKSRFQSCSSPSKLSVTRQHRQTNQDNQKENGNTGSLVYEERYSKRCLWKLSEQFPT